MAPAPLCDDKLGAAYREIDEIWQGHKDKAEAIRLIEEVVQRAEARARRVNEEAEEGERRVEERARRVEEEACRAEEKARQAMCKLEVKWQPVVLDVPVARLGSRKNGKGTPWTEVLEQTRMCTHLHPDDAELSIDLYDKVFMDFRDNLQSVTPTANACALFLKLFVDMGQVCEDGVLRLYTFMEALASTEGFLPHDASVTEGKGGPDLAITLGESGAGVGTAPIVCMVGGLREDRSTSYLRLCYCYQQHLRNLYEEMSWEAFCSKRWPMLLLHFAGPAVTAVGAVWMNGHAGLEPLANPVLLHIPSSNAEAIMHAMRFLTAVQLALEALVARLRVVPSPPETEEQPPQQLGLFPWRTRFGDIAVKYERLLQMAVPVVLARVTEGNERVAAGERVVVKFVNGRYGIEAHRAMAACGSAPEVYAYEAVGRRWTGIVMAFVEGGTLANCCVDARRGAQLRAVIGRLHEAGFVFGDFRLGNVLVGADDELMLCDFDWAGREGDATYPYTINPRIEWPRGVHGGGRIVREHDLTWLDWYCHGIVMNGVIVWIQRSEATGGGGEEAGC